VPRTPALKAADGSRTRDLELGKLALYLLSYRRRGAMLGARLPYGCPLAFAIVSSKSFAVVIAVLAVVGLLGFGLLSKGEASLSVGDRAPDKELSRLGAPGAGEIADYRGKWVLVNFWASWCEPCKAEAPALESFQNAHSSNGFTVLGINLDDSTDDALSFVRRYSLTYPQLREGDGRDRRDAYGMTGFPESFLIDPQGHVALIRRGPVNSDYLDRTVLPMIGSQT
jgi:cytochrome c biogenesis protein CcmG, thiol:disulfide interchange protein DsbE